MDAIGRTSQASANVPRLNSNETEGSATGKNCFACTTANMA